ncbi:MAG: glycosyltransferase [Pseudomonadota bacterium]
MTPHLILVSRYFPPTNIVGAIRPFRLARHMANVGWTVDVVHGPHDFNALESDLADSLPDRIQCHPAQTGRSQTQPRSRFVKRWHQMTRLLGSKVTGLDSELDLARSMAKRIEALLSQRDPSTPSVLVTSTPPHSLHVVGLLLRAHRDLPWIVDLRDPWDQFVRTGRHDQPHIIARTIERRAMRKARFVISTTEGYTDVLRRRFPSLDAGKFRTITNSYAMDDGPPKDVHVPDDTSVRVVYTGIFYPAKDPYTFFRALGQWKRRSSPAQWQHIAERLRVDLVGVADATTPRVIAELGISDIVTLITRVPQHEARERCRHADFLLIASGLSDKSREGWLPSKLFEYLAAKRPIIAVCREGELARLIRDSNCGFLFQDEDPKPIIALLEDALERKARGQSIADDLSYSGIERYSEEAVFSQFAQLAQETAVAKDD